MRISVCCLFALSLMGCARSATLPLAADKVMITTAAAPVCGPVGAQQVALRRAAIETIRRGFDNFLIVGAGNQNNVRVVGHTPIVAQTSTSIYGTSYGGSFNAYGNGTTTYSGGQPIIGGTHDQRLVVQMFKADDPASAKAISARAHLGPKWSEIVKENPSTTCFNNNQ